MKKPNEPSQLAKIAANQVIEIAFKQQQLEDFVGVLAGLRELLLHHPGFCELCEAIEGIAQGYNVLCELNVEVNRM